MEKRKKYVMPCIDIVIREVHSPFLAASNEDEYTGDQFGKEVEMEEDLWGSFSDDIKDYSEEWFSEWND